MRKLFAVGLAALIGAGAIATTAGEAAAKSAPYPYGYDDYYRGHHPPLAYLYFGTPIFGFGIRTPHLFHWHHRHEWREHVAWCTSRYRTYNPTTDTYFVRRGVAARCVSPRGW